MAAMKATLPEDKRSYISRNVAACRLCHPDFYRENVGRERPHMRVWENAYPSVML